MDYGRSVRPVTGPVGAMQCDDAFLMPWTISMRWVVVAVLLRYSWCGYVLYAKILLKNFECYNLSIVRFIFMILKASLYRKVLVKNTLKSLVVLKLLYIWFHILFSE